MKSNEIKREIMKINSILKDEGELLNVIKNKLEQIYNCSGDKKAQVLCDNNDTMIVDINVHDEIYNIEKDKCDIYLTREGYLKILYNLNHMKHKFKEGDVIIKKIECNNVDEAIFITDKGNIIKQKLYDLEDNIPQEDDGYYLPKLLGLEKDENVIWICSTNNPNESITIYFDDGYAFNIEVAKLISKLTMTSFGKNIVKISENKRTSFLLFTQNGRCMNLKNLPVKSVTSKGVKGMKIMDLYDGDKIIAIIFDVKEKIKIRITDNQENSCSIQIKQTSYYTAFAGAIGLQCTDILNKLDEGDIITSIDLIE